MDVAQALKFAVMVANDLWKDPEAESAAGEALVRALNSYKKAESETSSALADALKAHREAESPEAKSAASETLSKALRAFASRVPLKHYIRVCVKRAVFHEWRKKRDRHAELTSTWEHVFTVDTPESELAIPQEDWQLLVEHYIDGRYLDIIARDRGVSVYAIRKLMTSAVQKFLESERGR